MNNLKEIIYNLSENIMPELEKGVKEYPLNKYKGTRFNWEKVSIFGMLDNVIVVTESWDVIIYNNTWMDYDCMYWDSIVCHFQWYSKWDVSK